MVAGFRLLIIDSNCFINYLFYLLISEADINSAVVLPLSTDKFNLLTDVKKYGENLSVLDICKQSSVITPSHVEWPSTSQQYK